MRCLLWCVVLLLVLLIFFNSVFTNNREIVKMEGKPVVNMGLTLFPPPPSKKKPSRKLSTRYHGAKAQTDAVAPNFERAKSPETLDGRQSAMSSRRPVKDNPDSMTDGKRPIHSNYMPMDEGTSTMGEAYVPQAGPSNNPFIRSHTSFSDAPTLVRSNSNASHSSIAKPKLSNNPGEPIIRSIFPRYNPDLPLTQQPYYPTQASPTHIPHNVISRSPYSPGLNGRIQSIGPLSAPATITSFSHGISGSVQDNATKAVPPASTEELKELWKVLNGWKASASEGRSFCLKMTSSVELPIHTLSSATQPFYTLRLDPTSTSAVVTLTRQDPYKDKGKLVSPRIGSRSPSPVAGLEVLRTTLEEPSRRLPPNDGLVALLYPEAAANMVLDLSTKRNTDSAQVTAAAEHECARLVWDSDNATYYLCHPAMSSPFSVQIERSPAWSKVEYTLEHPQLRLNLVKLTRDGAGGGFLEVNTAVASQIESFYIVDVAIIAVLLVAIEEEKKQKIEHFEPPPSFAPPLGRPDSVGKAKSIMSVKNAFKKSPRMEEMEIDLESQSDLSKKGVKEKLPKPTRGLLGLLFMLLRFIVWALTLTVNVLAKLIIGVSTCLTKA